MKFKVVVGSQLSDGEIPIFGSSVFRVTRTRMIIVTGGEGCIVSAAVPGHLQEVVVRGRSLRTAGKHVWFGQSPIIIILSRGETSQNKKIKIKKGGIERRWMSDIIILTIVNSASLHGDPISWW